MKKIIIFYDYFTPAKNAGGIVRSINNLISLLSKDFEFYIFTSAYDLGAAKRLEGIIYDRWSHYADNAQVYYATKSIFLFGKVRNEIRRIQPDVIYVNGIFSPVFLIAPIMVVRQRSTPPVIVICPRGMVQKGALSLKPIKKEIYLGLLSYFKLLHGVRWHATDKQEFEDIRNLFGSHTKIVLAFLAVDTPNVNVPQVRVLNKQPNQLRLVFLSLITEKKNLLYLLFALMKLPLDIDVEFHVYGPIKDKEYWKSCLRAAALLPAHIHFEYKGTVNPENVISVIQEYHFFVLPSYGENFGHAIYESLLAGRPVIISDKTPWKDMEDKHAGFVFSIEESRLPEYIEKAARMNKNSYNQYCSGAQKVASDYLKDNDFRSQYLNLFQS